MMTTPELKRALRMLGDTLSDALESVSETELELLGRGMTLDEAHEFERELFQLQVDIVNLGNNHVTDENGWLLPILNNLTS